jgi:hypothetical protein
MICTYCNSDLDPPTNPMNDQQNLMIFCDICNVIYYCDGRIFQISTTIMPYQHYVCFYYNKNKTEIWSVKCTEETQITYPKTVIINNILNINPNNIQEKLKLYLTIL